MCVNRKIDEQLVRTLKNCDLVPPVHINMSIQAALDPKELLQVLALVWIINWILIFFCVGSENCIWHRGRWRLSVRACWAAPLWWPRTLFNETVGWLPWGLFCEPGWLLLHEIVWRKVNLACLNFLKWFDNFVHFSADGVIFGYPMSDFVLQSPVKSLSYEAKEVCCHALEMYCERLKKGCVDDLKVNRIFANTCTKTKILR